MKYSFIEDEDNQIKKSPKDIINDIFEEEEVTDKIPIDIFKKIHDCSYCLEPSSVIRIILLQSKPEYISYYNNTIYAIIIKNEDDNYWFGIPIKNPAVGIMNWEKKRWNKIYGFSLSINLQVDSDF